MIKIVTDEPLYDMSEWMTPDCQDEPCSNCRMVKKAVHKGDMDEFRRCTEDWDAETAELEAQMRKCKCCIWYWIDEVEEV